jgi:YXWGXW repeat-containing protein
MLIRKTMLCASFVLGAISLPASAQTIVGAVTVDIAPPPARVEVVPAPRVGFVWAPGYWRWEEPRRTHVWVEGRFVEERPGYRYVPDRWVARDRRYYYEPNRWEVIVR